MNLRLNLCPGLGELVAETGSRFVAVMKQTEIRDSPYVGCSYCRVRHVGLFHGARCDDLVPSSGDIALRPV